MDIRDKDGDTNVRLCSFNINGLNTLFNYHPWNGLKTLDLAFEFLKCDIVTLQELKISQVTSNLILKNYKSFITIPKFKKGYSGVGVYVRQVQGNDKLQKLLTVKKVEEGLIGSLPLNKLVSYRDAAEQYSNECIGGYPTVYNDPNLDSEGRCIIIELNYNIVIISLYCPANSLGTDDNEFFRMNFLHALIERCRNLIALGKEVVVMGDINVSRDLIDSDEYIKEGIKLDCIKKVVDQNSDEDIGEEFEKLNHDEVIKFRQLTESKKLINDVIFDHYFESNFFNDKERDPIFIDTLRKSQKRRLKMYTCWNTLKNYRPINSGSRIDHIFLTPKLTIDCHADIWNKLMGSDHCPIYCDFNWDHYVSSCEDVVVAPPKALKFEANSYYGVNNGGNSIDRFFRSDKRKLPEESVTEDPVLIATTPLYTSRKKKKPDQLGITSFFFATKEQKEQEELKTSNSQSSQVSIDAFNSMLNSGKSGPPNCYHDETATLRKSMKPLTKGKKFWCCARSATSETFSIKGDKEEDRCDFFKWASK